MKVHGPARSVEEVMGRLFDKPGTSRGRPSEGPGARRQASRSVRAARGVPSAFFKNIRGAGTTSRAGLMGQMEYILNPDKVTFVFDSQCRFDRTGTLERAEMLALTKEWEATWRYPTKLGNTTHMVMSFPKGTDPLAVMEITRSVCAEKLQGEHGVYDYLATVHTDTEHPHAHVIVNRFPEEGGLFTLKRDGAHSFQAFKESIADHALPHGVELSTASRFERGNTDRPATHEDVQKARREGRPLPPDRPREGYDLEYALERVDEAALIYAATSVVAGSFGLKRIEEICVKATLTLEEGEKLDGRERMTKMDQDQYDIERENALRETYAENAAQALALENGTAMAELQGIRDEAERFDTAVEVLGQSMERLRTQIATVPDAERPAVERDYVDILKDLKEAAPDTLQGARLGQDASHHTPYNEAFVVDKDVVRHPEFTRVLDERLAGTGISADEMRARLETGADNDELASIWAERDMTSIAAARGLDIADPSNRRAVEQELTDFYEELRLDLLQYRAASMAPEFRELARMAERQEPGVYPPYAGLRPDEVLADGVDRVRDVTGIDPTDVVAVRAYLEGTTPDLDNAEARQLLTQDAAAIERIEQGVAAQHDGPVTEYSRFEALIVARGIEGTARSEDRVAETFALDDDLRSGRLTESERRDTEALIRDMLRGSDVEFRGAELSDAQHGRIAEMKATYLPAQPERDRLAADLAGMAQAVSFRYDQARFEAELREANVPPHLINAGLSVHRDTAGDNAVKPTVPPEFVRGLGRELREELQIERPTVEDFDAHIKNEAPELHPETRNDLARRLHDATHIQVETVARDDRPVFTQEGRGRVIADLDRSLSAGVRPTDASVRTDIAKVVRDSLDKDELERLERGDAQALGKLTPNALTQRVMAFEYLRSEVSGGRSDLVAPMQRLNREAQQTIDQGNAQTLDNPSQKLR